MKRMALAALSGLLLSCGGGGGGGGATTTTAPPPPPPGTIYVGSDASGGYGGTGSNVFLPTTLTVKAGDTVTWSWQTSGHTVDSGTSCTPDAAGPDHYSSNGTQNAGFTMTHQFMTAGTYHYYCTTHCGTGMTGTITVNP